MIAMAYDNAKQRCDLVRQATSTYTNLALDFGLQSAVNISWFTDRRADPTDQLPGGPKDDPRGWWGDGLSTIANDQIGSRRWLLERAVASVENQNLAAEYMVECLQWMLDDGVASAINVAILPLSFLALDVDIVKPDGTKYSSQWAVELGRQASLNQ